MITKVRLKNWRSHLESEFNFSTGTNALLGHMGSGKSTVLDGACFALFGTFPTLQTKKLKLDDIIMKKPIEKNRAEAEVFFQVGEKNYSVRRVIDKGKGTSYSEVREDGSLLEAPNSQRVTELVEKTLKVNYELFSKAVYSEQNALDYFLTIPKGQRMKKIDELLMIDRFETARANAVALTNRIIERKIGKQTIIDQIDVEELLENVSESKNHLNQILLEKEQLSKSLNEASNGKNLLEKEVVELQKIRESLDLLKRDEKGVSSVLEETVKSLKSLEDVLKEQEKGNIEKTLEELKQRSEEFETELKKKQKVYEKISSLFSESVAKIDFLKKEKIEKLEKEIDERLRIKKEFEHLKGIIGEDTVKQLDEKKTLYEKLIGEVQELRTKITDLDDMIRQLSSLEGKCPICESKLTEERKNLLIKQKQQQIKALKERLEEASKKKELGEKEIKKIEDAVKKLDEMVIEIKDFDALKTDLGNSKRLLVELSEYSAKAENQLSQIRKETEDLNSQLKQALEKKQEFEILYLKQKDHEEKRKRFDELFKAKNHIEAEIEKLEQKISGKDLIELESRLKGLIAREKEIETKILGFDQLIKEKESRIKEYESSLNEAIRQKGEIQKLDKIVKDLKIFEKALEQTQIELRTEFVEAVNYTMNKLWSTLYPYQDFIGINLSIEEGDYVLQLKEKAGRFVAADGVASGGERSIACLALRIAFALVLAPHIRLLVLDEPTVNLDSAAVKELARTLRERIGEFIDQTFLITHQSELEDAVTGNAYRLERDKAKDEATKIITIS